MMGLRPSTAERIRRILDRSPGSEQTYGTGRWKGLRPTLVRCTSATAADTSGVGAQCYPGIIVDLEPTGTSQDDLDDGAVWLTVYGNDMVPQVPEDDGIYLCVLLGDVEADTGDTRPRAVSIPLAGNAVQRFVRPSDAPVYDTVYYAITTGGNSVYPRVDISAQTDDIVVTCAGYVSLGGGAMATLGAVLAFAYYDVSLTLLGTNPLKYPVHIQGNQTFYLEAGFRASDRETDAKWLTPVLTWDGSAAVKPSGILITQFSYTTRPIIVS